LQSGQKREPRPGDFRDCSIATGADSKIARQEQGESTWDPLNASELAPNSANGLIPSLIAWAKSQRPGNVAIVSEKQVCDVIVDSGPNRPKEKVCQVTVMVQEPKQSEVRVCGVTVIDRPKLPDGPIVVTRIKDPDRSNKPIVIRRDVDPGRMR
jgi:hypothetical protein